MELHLFLPLPEVQERHGSQRNGEIRLQASEEKISICGIRKCNGIRACSSTVNQKILVIEIFCG